MFTKGTDIVAIHFSDSSVMALRLDNQNKKYSVTATSVVNLKPGIIEDGRIIALPELTAAVESLLANAKPQALKPKEVVISVPESKVFSTALQLPLTLSAGDLADSLRRKAAEVIPVEDQLLVADYRRHQVGQMYEYFYAATYQTILDDFEKLFTNLHIKLRMATVESMALATILGVPDAKQSVLILDIGARTTIASVVTDTYLRESVTIANAGDLWTKAIAQEQSVSWDEAEKLKQSTGIISSPDNTLTAILLPWLQRWSAEIKQFVTYWQQSHNETISQVVLVGGSAQLPGLLEYCQTAFEVSVIIGKAPAGLSFDQSGVARYLTIAGLAMMAIDEKLDDINFVLPKLKSIKRSTTKSQVVAQPTVAPSVITPPKEKNHKSTILLLAIFFIALLVFGAIWWRSQTPQAAIPTPSITSDNYQSADIVYTILTIATSTPDQGHPSIKATIEGQTQTIERKQLSAEYWQTLSDTVARAGGNSLNKNDVYQALLQDQTKLLWRANLDTLTSKYAPDGLILPTYLDYTIATSSPSINKVVPGSDVFLNITVTYRSLLVDKKTFEQILATEWQKQFQQDLPTDYKTIELTITPLSDGVYQAHQIVNGLIR